MPRIEVGKTFMGEKILLKAGTVVARGAVLLAPDTCVFLGGKIDAWHTAWAEGRLAMLKEKVGADRPMGS
jgi:RecQ-mediated genome instability protein 1